MSKAFSIFPVTDQVRAIAPINVKTLSRFHAQQCPHRFAVFEFTFSEAVECEPLVHYLAQFDGAFFDVLCLVFKGHHSKQVKVLDVICDILQANADGEKFSGGLIVRTAQWACEWVEDAVAVLSEKRLMIPIAFEEKGQVNVRLERINLRLAIAYAEQHRLVLERRLVEGDLLVAPHYDASTSTSTKRTRERLTQEEQVSLAELELTLQVQLKHAHTFQLHQKIDAERDVAYDGAVIVRDKPEKEKVNLRNLSVMGKNPYLSELALTQHWNTVEALLFWKTCFGGVIRLLNVSDRQSLYYFEWRGQFLDITALALRQLFLCRDQLRQGIDFNHLPKGFSVTDHAQKKTVLLSYDPLAAKYAETQSAFEYVLEPALPSTPFNLSVAEMLLENAGVSALQDSNIKQYRLFLTHFSVVASLPDAILDALLEAPSLEWLESVFEQVAMGVGLEDPRGISDEDVIGMRLAGLKEGSSGIQLNKTQYQIEPSPFAETVHAIIALQAEPADLDHLVYRVLDAHGHDEMINTLQSFSCTVGQLNAVLHLYGDLGVEGIAGFLAFMDRLNALGIDAAPFLAARDYAFYVQHDLSAALNQMVRFGSSDSPQRQWWSVLFARHVHHCGITLLQELLIAFIQFSEAVRELGLEFYALNRHDAFSTCSNMLITLPRILTLLKHAPSEDRDVQWASCPTLDLTASGAIRAIHAFEGIRDGVFSVVAPEMNVAPSAFHWARSNGHLKAVGYDVGKKTNETLNIATEEAFFRAIGKMHQRYSIDFYRRVVALLEALDLSAHKAVLLHILFYTLSCEHTLVTYEEVSAFFEIKVILTSLKHDASIFGISLTDEVVNILSRLKEAPPLFYLSQLVYLLSNSLRSYNLFELKRRGDFLEKTARELNTLVQRHGFCVYEGMRHYDARCWERNQRKYEDDNVLCEHVRIAKLISSGYFSSHLIALISTFHLDGENLDELIHSLRATDMTCVYRLLKHLRELSTDHEPLTKDDLLHLSGAFNRFVRKVGIRTLQKPQVFEFGILHFLEYGFSELDAFAGRFSIHLQGTSSVVSTETFSGIADLFPEDYFRQFEASQYFKKISPWFAHYKDEIKQLIEDIFYCFSSVSDFQFYNQAASALKGVASQLQEATLMHVLTILYSFLMSDPSASIEDFIGLLESLNEKRVEWLFIFQHLVGEAGVDQVLARLHFWFLRMLAFSTSAHEESVLTSVEIASLIGNITLASEYPLSVDRFNQDVRLVLESIAACPILKEAVLSLFTSIVTLQDESSLAFTRFLGFLSTTHSLLFSPQTQHKGMLLEIFVVFDQWIRQGEASGLLELIQVIPEDISGDDVCLFLKVFLVNHRLGSRLTLAESQDVFSRIRSGAGTRGRIKQFFDQPPYMKWDAALSFLEADEAFDYDAFSRCPFPRSPDNEFELDYAIQQLTHFSCFDHGGDPDVIRAMALDIQGHIFVAKEMTTELLWSSLEALKERYSDPTQTVPNVAQFVVFMAEFLFRANATKNGVSYELNTTQLLACYAMLSSGQKVYQQVDTGEGKSRIMMVVAGCAALMGKSVTFVTSHLLLAKRDFIEYQPFMRALSLSTILMDNTTTLQTFRAADVRFTGVGHFALFLNSFIVEKGHEAADIDFSTQALLLDEADKFFFDTKIHFNFSGLVDPKKLYLTWVYPLLIQFFRQGSDGDVSPLDLYFDDVDACNREFRGFVKLHVMDASRRQLLDSVADETIERWHKAAVTALALQEGKDFCVFRDQLIETAEGPVLSHWAKPLVDKRAADVTYSNAIQQCLHARLNLDIPGEQTGFYMAPESTMICSTTVRQVKAFFQNSTVFATTGSAGSSTERAELFGYTTIEAPRHNLFRRDDLPTRMTANRDAQIQTLRDEIEMLWHDDPYSNGLLIFCVDDTQGRIFYEGLPDRPVVGPGFLQHIHSGMSEDERREAIERAGQCGVVSIVTDAEGRGTHFELEARMGANLMGHGLRVRLTYLPTTRNLIQNFGRAARYGLYGDARMVLSCEDVPPEALQAWFYDLEGWLEAAQFRMDRSAQVHRILDHIFSEVIETCQMHFYATDIITLEQYSIWSTVLKTLKQEKIEYLESFLSQLDPLAVDIPEFRVAQAYLRFFNFALDLIRTELDDPSFMSTYPLEAIDVLPPEHHRLFASMEDVEFEHKSSSVFSRYDPALDGRAKVYSGLFEESSATLWGERAWFANSRAYWRGEGALFADTRASMTGNRPWFANTRRYFGW